MSDPLTGWGVVDPEGRLLRLAPEAAEQDAWSALETYLYDLECSELADEEIGPIFNGSPEAFEASVHALGYRAVQVTLTEATE